jgi:hypothetical protein
MARAIRTPYDGFMKRKYAIYAPPDKDLPHLVAILKNNRLKDAFVAADLPSAEILLRNLHERTEAKGG